MRDEIILIHGWDPSKYSNSNNSGGVGAAWTHRTELINLLEKKYKIHYCNLPGFLGVPEPTRPYDLEDFSSYLKDWKARWCPDPLFILGYSFGGAVALTHKVIYNDTARIVLVSPALERQLGMRSLIGGYSKKFIPKFAMQNLKSFYQQLMSPYYRSGSDFLRQSYDLIVRRKILNELGNIPTNSALLIYGDQDKDTPWSIAKPIVTELNIKHSVIVGGRHSIGQTHPKEIVDAITAFIENR